MVRFGRDVCRDPALSLHREWLETNGLGGFASSTIAGLNTRRYHGLLVAATHPPVGRLVLLNKVEETIVCGDVELALGANQYPGVIHPTGHELLEQFRLDPFPVFTYAAEGVRLEKTVFMVHGQNATVVGYALLEAPQSATLYLRPLLSGRDYHHLVRAQDTPAAAVAEARGLLCFAPCGHAPGLWLAYTEGAFRTGGAWYYDFQYERERERGLDHQEDLYSPGHVEAHLEPGQRVSLLAAFGEAPNINPEQAAEFERRRRAALSSGEPDDALGAALYRATDHFVVRRGKRRSIIAGYHWFADWGRDALIALPGLLLVTGRYGDAREVLSAFADRRHQGIIPNNFADAGDEPAYNSVDASLWFIHAVRRYYDYALDLDFIRDHMLPVVEDIVHWYTRGTLYGIQATPDGLLRAGAQGVQLTWMDAKVGDWVVTPRWGKPVEVNALWYNALKHVEYLCKKLGLRQQSREYGRRARQAKAAFNQVFWNPEAGCLYDCVSDRGPDASMRPNQILAVALPYSLVAQQRQRQIVAAVQQHLLTPMGLRSLSPLDDRYVGRYQGDVRSRDAAYHQGTVWPWLLGPFLAAYVKAHGRTPEAKARAREMLAGFEQHLCEAGLGLVSEIFDGDEPHLPKGCIAQAWSVGELLRALVEDVGVPRRAE
ncbi:MAG: amylo-alpha-1,6-glucosidase [Armatimonadota bacterium]